MLLTYIFSLFPTMFSKGFFPKFIESQDCLATRSFLGPGGPILTLSEKTNFRLFQTEIKLQSTISNLIEMEESAPNR